MLHGNWKKFSLFFLLLFALTACVPVSPNVPVATSVPTTDTGPTAESASDNGCPVPTADSQLLRNDPAGYCLLLPVDFEATINEETNGAVVAAPATTPCHRERLFITVEDALGRSLQQMAEQVLTDNLIPGLEYELSPDAQLGGGPAFVIGKMPGQDLIRRVIALRDGRVYTLVFVPDDATQQPASAEMETLYAIVMATFAFIPPTQPTGIPLPDGYPANPAISWQRRVLGDGGVVAECQRMDISAKGETALGTCTESQTRQSVTPAQWEEIQARFQPFVYESGEFTLRFAGQGEIYDPAWNRALVRWAQGSYGELSSGRVSAAGRTGVSWWLGEVDGQAGMCKHLIVLDFGYAYANIDPCVGGESQSTTGGWLETPEMQAFDALLYGFVTTYQDDSYFNGLGEQTMGAAELEQINNWAAQVFERLHE